MASRRRGPREPLPALGGGPLISNDGAVISAPMDPQEDQEDQELQRIAALPLEERAAQLSQIVDRLEAELEETAHPQDDELTF